ncbi:MAG: 6-phosphogluconolactonase [Thermoguttaceae bacterium]|jgi:6-phosphogluconolactonase
MATPVVSICADSHALAVRAADIVIQAARDAVAKRGRFTFVLSGGSTPEKTYALLAEADRAAAIDWPRVYLFFGDERLVPAEDPRSNFGMVRKNLLARVPVPPANIFSVPTQGCNAAEASAAYAKMLADFFSLSERTIPPHFDLIFLGLGGDGHTASLFPFADALYIMDTWTTWTSPGTFPPPVDRITLTYPVLNAARQVVFLASGKDKAAALRDVLEEHASYEDRPAAGVRPADGTLIWLVDKEAARLLAHNH